MKRIISLLCVACLVLITACSDDKEVGPIFDSVLTPDFTFDDGAEIIAGVDAVQFTDNSTAKGTEISGYFWHFGFAGLGNWSEEAAPDPVMYKEAGEYVVTLTVYGADGNSSSTKRTIVVKAANLAAEAVIRPGVPMKDIDRAARKLIEDAGYGPFFTHRLGHFIGQTEHEKGDVSATNTTLAKPGMIFSIEPGVYLPGEFGVRVEDLVLVTEDGCEILNHVDKHWKTVG